MPGLAFLVKTNLFGRIIPTESRQQITAKKEEKRVTLALSIKSEEVNLISHLLAPFLVTFNCGQSEESQCDQMMK